MRKDMRWMGGEEAVERKIAVYAWEDGWIDRKIYLYIYICVYTKRLEVQILADCATP